MVFQVQDTKGKWSPPITEQQIAVYIRDGFIKAHTLISDGSGRTYTISKHPSFAAQFSSTQTGSSSVKAGSNTEATRYKVCPECRSKAKLDAQVCGMCQHLFRTKFPTTNVQGSEVNTHSASSNPMVQNESKRVVCSRCGKSPGILQILSFNKNTGRCAQCETAHRNALESFRTQFVRLTSRSVTDADISALKNHASSLNLAFPEALVYARSDALIVVNKAIIQAARAGITNPASAQYINDLIRRLEIPESSLVTERSRIQSLVAVSEIRSGKLPTLSRHAYASHLESDEICHLVCDASFVRVMARGPVLLSGTLLATNKKLRFLSSEHGGMEIAWRKVMRVSQTSQGVRLELSTQRGNGEYLVDDPLRTEAIIDTIAREAKRNIVFNSGSSTSRHIPHDVKSAVWQRDGGCCVQCGESSYLEFDHIIPHSKGGANSVGNVQLLCRNCNANKGNRI